MLITTILALASTVTAASLQQVTNYGTPSKVPMYIYVPDKLATNPPIVVATHYCSGTAQAYFSGTSWKSSADSKGFIVIYPSSPYSGTCWDVSSKATLTHNGGGDSNSIANMVKYALDKYKGDPNRVYASGESSGGMMTNVLAATYPEIFKAAAVYCGVPAGCFVSASGAVDAWNSTCSGGQSINTAATWANVVKNMGGSAPYPKMQIWHGSSDTTLYPQNYQETIKQWTGVFGLSQTATSTQQNTPQSGYTTSNYADSSGKVLVQGILAAGVGHCVPQHPTQTLEWFGL